jgi:hypothetical protein
MDPLTESRNTEREGRVGTHSLSQLRREGRGKDTKRTAKKL